MYSLYPSRELDGHVSKHSTKQTSWRWSRPRFCHLLVDSGYRSGPVYLVPCHCHLQGGDASGWYWAREPLSTSYQKTIQDNAIFN